jgi:hypothetical protein
LASTIVTLACRRRRRNSADCAFASSFENNIGNTLNLEKKSQRPGAVRSWDDPAIRDSLSWYLAVAENRRSVKFRIAVTLPTQLDPAQRRT